MTPEKNVKKEPPIPQETSETTATENETVKTNPQKKEARSASRKSASFLAKIAILSAFGAILLFVEFPIFPATPWLKLNLSDLPTLLASFMFGPVSGTAVNAVKLGIALLIRGTSTGFVGDLSNLISGTLYAVTAGLIYKIRKDKHGAVLALVVSGIVFCVSMILCNAFILLPAFGITDKDAMSTTLLLTLAFNLIKTTLTGIATFLLYKKLHSLFKKF